MISLELFFIKLKKNYKKGTNYMKSISIFGFDLNILNDKIVKIIHDQMPMTKM